MISHSFLTCAAVVLAAAQPAPLPPPDVTLDARIMRVSPPIFVRLELTPPAPRLQPVGLEFVPGTNGDADLWRWTFDTLPTDTLVEQLALVLISTAPFTPSAGLPPPETCDGRHFQTVPLAVSFADFGNQRVYSATMIDVWALPALRSLDGAFGAIVAVNGASFPSICDDRFASNPEIRTLRGR